jgi:capsular polysaccharide biosynthesis protein
MELKRYLGLVLRRWKLVVLVTVATVIAMALMGSGGTSSYESSGTYVVRPRILDVDETVRATETLNRGAEINSTYARIARSKVVEGVAKELLRDQGLDTSGLQATSSVVPGTNIVVIGATGPDPEVVSEYARTLGETAADYLIESAELFELHPLDTPRGPGDPVPTRRSLTVVVSVVFGLFAGAALAFGVEYFSESAVGTDLNLVDRQTGTYRPEYFRLRLREEMARCGIDPLSRDPTGDASGNGRSGRRRSPKAAVTPERADAATASRFSLGLVTVEATDVDVRAGVANADLRLVARSLRPRLREQDFVARIGDDTLAVIFPGLKRDDASRLLDDRNEVSATLIGDVSMTVRMCECSPDGVLGDEEAMRVAIAV